jgi:hypothetical protein
MISLPPYNLINKRFGILTVTKEAPSKTRVDKRGWKTTERRWECRCDCGKTSIADGSSLRIGHTMSCGCRKLDNRKGNLHPYYGRPSPHGKRVLTLRGEWVRSNKGEKTICDWLYTHGINYIYEPKTFHLQGFNYTPDLFIPEWNVYTEIKGWWRTRSGRVSDEEKFKAFLEEYGNIILMDAESIKSFLNRK